MAFDAFLKIDGIPGESSDDKHKDWIEILAFSHGISQPAGVAATAAGARTAERAIMQDFSITKTLDKSSPKLALALCSGTHIKEVQLELCRAGGDKAKYMVYKLSDVIISSIRPGGSAKGGETLPLEEMSFNYGKIEWTYTQYDPATGRAIGSVASGWDLVANKGA